MRFVFLYRGGNVAEQQQAAYMAEWGAWTSVLMQNGSMKAGQPFAGGKVVTKTSVNEYKAYDNDVAGYSELELESLESAVKLAQSAPNVMHGGTVEVREVMPM